jgi:hypothetical protein
MLYDKPRLGIGLMALVFGISVANAITTQTVLASNGTPTLLVESHVSESAKMLWYFNVLSSAGLLGFTIAAMFLGHWYLNAPEMNLDPLRRLLLVLALCIVMRAICNGVGLALELSVPGLSSTQWILVGLRWLAGIFGTAALVAMSWQTLKIPNTQSATGILYVAVVTSFLGELTSLLLSRSTAFPL